MASYSTIPKDEAEPLVAAAPKAASPKFKAAALALCIASAVAGYQAAPAAAKYLSFWATGGDNLPWRPRREVNRQRGRGIGPVPHQVHGEVLVGARRTATRAARETRAGPLAMIVDETIPRPRARR